MLGKALPYALAGAPTLTSIFLKTFTGPPRAEKWTWRPAGSLPDAMNRGAKIMPAAGYDGLALISVDYCGLAWINLDQHGLAWISLD